MSSYCVSGRTDGRLLVHNFGGTGHSISRVFIKCASQRFKFVSNFAPIVVAMAKTREEKFGAALAEICGGDRALLRTIREEWSESRGERVPAGGAAPAPPVPASWHPAAGASGAVGETGPTNGGPAVLAAPAAPAPADDAAEAAEEELVGEAFSDDDLAFRALVGDDLAAVAAAGEAQVAAQPRLRTGREVWTAQLQATRALVLQPPPMPPAAGDSDDDLPLVQPRSRSPVGSGRKGKGKSKGRK